MSNGMNRIRFEEDLKFGFSNTQATGKLPSPLPDALLLNLGCGNDIREGFVNIDLFSNDSRVVFGDIRKLELPDNSADLILASDVLEHFSHRETQAILDEWARVLKHNGELIVRCPSLKLQAKAYINGVWNADIASYMIFGGQTNPGDYHCVAFDEESIKDKLHKAGFLITEFSEDDTPQDRGYINLNMTVRSRKREVRLEMFDSNTESSPYFAKNTPSTEIQKPYYETHDPIEQDDDLFDIDLLNEIVNPSNNIHQESEIVSNTSIVPNDSSPVSIPKLNIVWEGSQFVWHSLALINREHCLNLIDSGVANVTIIPYEPDSFASESNAKYEKLKSNDIRFKAEVSDEIGRLPYVWVRHQWPPKAEPPKGAKWIIMQPWEFTAHRQDFVEIFKHAEEIWTPSNFSRQSFINSGIPFDMVQVIPNGIDPVLFSPHGSKYPLRTAKRVRLLYVGGTIYRKGFDILLEAYLNTFSSEDDVVLVVKDMGGDTFYRGQTAKDLIREAQLTSNTAEIIYLDNSMTEEEIASLYRACTVFVSPYRGEGFSLPTLEAMACGLPVVVTKGGSTDDFTDIDCAWYINAEKMSIGNAIDNKLLTGEAFLLEPNRDELCSTLKYIAGNPTQAYSAGIIASAKARKDWTWRHATIKALERIDYLSNTQLASEADEKLPKFSDDFIELGMAEKHYIRANYTTAKDLFESLAYSDLLTQRDKTHIYNRLAQIALIATNFEKAEHYVEYSLKHKIDNLDTQYIKAQIVYEKGSNTEALEIMIHIFDNWTLGKYNCTLGAGLDDMLVFCGDIAFAEEDLEGSHQYYTAALKMNTQNPAACFGAGLCFERIGNQDAAETMFDWAEKLNPAYRRD